MRLGKKDGATKSDKKQWGRARSPEVGVDLGIEMRTTEEFLVGNIKMSGIDHEWMMADPKKPRWS